MTTNDLQFHKIHFCFIILHPNSSFKSHFMRPENFSLLISNTPFLEEHSFPLLFKRSRSTLQSFRTGKEKKYTFEKSQIITSEFDKNQPVLLGLA